MAQLDLAPPAQRHSATSKAAATSIAPRAATLRERVLEFIKSRGGFGATDEEIQRDLDMNPSTERPRRIEILKAGLIEDSGTTRTTASGRSATVWRAA